MKTGKQSVNLASINMTVLKNFPVPLPPLAEQERIVAEVERRLSVIDELEQIVTANLKRASNLKQSILKKAFEG
jgi:type I restriction enzyme S subunit